MVSVVQQDAVDGTPQVSHNLPDAGSDTRASNKRPRDNSTDISRGRNKFAPRVLMNTVSTRKSITRRPKTGIEGIIQRLEVFGVSRTDAQKNRSEGLGMKAVNSLTSKVNVAPNSSFLIHL
ncbi:MAG: hypothetical protein BRC59_00295 [Cyanobacteria bacterium SW_4_48_29]|nr:MAG: hypothetical protein BRC59_00295 [Cyanobacteria bacterium SW_4_48_29]